MTNSPTSSPNCHEKHDNSMVARTVGALCLGPTGNEQGTHYFYSLVSGRIIRRTHFTELPIPADVIVRISDIGRDQGMPPTLTFGNRMGHEYPDLDGEVDDDHDADYDYHSDESDDEDADDYDNHYVYDPGPAEPADLPDGALFEDYDLPPPPPDGELYDDYILPPDLPPLPPAPDAPAVPPPAPDALPLQPPVAAPDGHDYDDYDLPPVNHPDPDDPSATTPTHLPIAPVLPPVLLQTTGVSGSPTGVSGSSTGVSASPPEINGQITGVPPRSPPVSSSPPLPPRPIPDDAPAPAVWPRPSHYVPNPKPNLLAFPDAWLLLSAQLPAAKGLKLFGDAGARAMTAELEQVHYRNVVKPIFSHDITRDEKVRCLRYLMYLKEKRCGKIKARGCADGRIQRLWKNKHETSSPTVRTESVFMSCVIDSFEQRTVAVCDIPGAFMQADIDEVVHMKFEGEIAELLVKIDPARYTPYVTYHRDKPVLYVQLNKALYGTLQAAKLFYDELSTFLTTELGFTINPYDSCVANKTINGKQ
ncbi:MAG: reverse transcriptase domain-containing protein [Dolichospermum sp.]